jgi:nucleosome binding factor SPN SPT16 subunit
MQGISNTRHRRMYDALQKLEQVMKDCGEIKDAQEMSLRRQQLESSYRSYIQLLETLSVHIFEYEELYGDIKANAVAKKLARLKRMIKPVNDNFAQLKDAIASHYGT